jgi:hypothetical protein
VVAAAGTGDAQITSSGFSRLFGYSITETAAAVATAVIRNGTSTSGAPLAYIGLPASGAQTVWFGPQGIAAPLGIFLDRVTGTTQVVVYVG